MGIDKVRRELDEWFGITGTPVAAAAVPSLGGGSGGSANDTIETVTVVPQLTDNSGGITPGDNTIAVIPNPADAPIDADALRDDLVANVLPPTKAAIAQLASKLNSTLAAQVAIRNNLADLTAKVNTILSRLREKAVIEN